MLPRWNFIPQIDSERLAAPALLQARCVPAPRINWFQCSEIAGIQVKYTKGALPLQSWM